MAAPFARHEPYLLSPATTGLLLEDFWPGLFFTGAVVGEIRRKVGQLAWARELLDQLRAQADAMLAAPPTLVMEPAGWRHDFYSRQTGEHLVFEPAGGQDFLDPSTHQRERDDAQRRAWVLLSHERAYRLLRSVGLLYQLTGEERYAAWVAQGLRQAAAYFALPLPRRPDPGGPAHYFSNLYDAAILAQIGAIYEMTRGSAAFTPADHDAIRRDIFEDRLPTMVEFLRRQPTHNMSCFVSLALATAGRLYQREDWIAPAFGQQTGLRSQLLAGVPADAAGRCDGFWYEGTLFYHFYSLYPLLGLWEIQRHRPAADHDLLQQRLCAMAAAPLQLLDDQWRLTVVGDLGNPRHMNLTRYAHLYEYAAGQLDAARFAPVVAALTAQRRAAGLAARPGWAALAFGPDELPAPADPPRRATLLPVAQLGVLRSSAPSRLQVAFRCGKPISGHDHPDRLQFTLHALGELIAPDLGEPGYSLRQRGSELSYYRTSAAHNMLCVDEQNEMGRADLTWGGDADEPWAQGVLVGEGYELRRRLLLRGDLLLVLDDCRATLPSTARRFGWMFHAYGKLTVDTPAGDEHAANTLGLPALPDCIGYAQWRQRQRGRVQEALHAHWRVSSRVGLQLVAATDSPCEFTAAVAPGQPYPDAMGQLMLRMAGSRWRLATVLRPHLLAVAPAPVGLQIKGERVRISDREAEAWETVWWQ